jgi:hypothetical protein
MSGRSRRPARGGFSSLWRGFPVLDLKTFLIIIVSAMLDAATPLPVAGVGISWPLWPSDLVPCRGGSFVAVAREGVRGVVV